jgi:hypothetical protein
VDVVRGEPAEAAAWPGAVAGNPLAEAVTHVTEGLAAAVLDRPDDLARHVEALMPLLRFIGPSYPTAVAHLLRALSLAGTARAAAHNERIGLLSELDDTISWLAARAADAPANSPIRL